MPEKQVLDKISIYIRKDKMEQNIVKRLVRLGEEQNCSVNHLVVEAILRYLGAEIDRDRKDKRTEYNKKYYDNHKDEIAGQKREYYENNKEKILECKKKYYEDNRERMAERRKDHKDEKAKYYEANKDRILKCQKKYYENNKDRIVEYSKKYYEDNRERIVKRQKKYREDNREGIAKHKREYYEDNKGGMAKRQKEYREDNREKIAEWHRKHHKENPEKSRAGSAKRRAIERGAIVVNTKGVAEIYRQAKEGYGLYCYICGELIDAGQGVVDHIFPISKHFAHAPFNLIPTHAKCNGEKSDKMPDNVKIYDRGVVERARQGHNLVLFWKTLKLVIELRQSQTRGV